MNTLQVILIALFIYLGAIGSIVGNTLGWYCVGRPLIAAFVVGLIMGDMSTAMLVGIPLQIGLPGQRHARWRGLLGLVLCHLYWHCHGNRPEGYCGR